MRARAPCKKCGKVVQHFRNGMPHHLHYASVGCGGVPTKAPGRTSLLRDILLAKGPITKNRLLRAAQKELPQTDVHKWFSPFAALKRVGVARAITIDGVEHYVHRDAKGTAT